MSHPEGSHSLSHNGQVNQSVFCDFNATPEAGHLIKKGGLLSIRSLKVQAWALHPFSLWRGLLAAALQEFGVAAGDPSSLGTWMHAYFQLTCLL